MLKNTTLKRLQEKGFKIERLQELDTYGLNTSGLLVRAGVKVTDNDGNAKNYQIIFSSRNYGNATQELKQYNGRIAEKHFKYVEKVNKWLADNGLEAVNII